MGVTSYIGTGGYVRTQSDGKREYSTICVVRPPSQEPLPFDDVDLLLWIRNTAPDVLAYVPSLQYWALDAYERCMDHEGNICGYQQRAWDFYWTLRSTVSSGRIMLGIGTGGIDGPFTFGTDRFCGVSPDIARYPNPNGYAHMALDANVTFPYYDAKFGGVMFNHVFEHITNQRRALFEALRVTVPGGFVCILQPDMAFSDRGSIDPTHVAEWSADAFLDWIKAQVAGCTTPYEVIEHNTLKNKFSVNTVLRRLELQDEGSVS